MKIVGYVRLSRANREESTSIVRQRELVEQYCSARGLELVGIIEDVDVSASKRRLDRPGLHEVRRMIAAKEADAVLVWRLDRLVRSVTDVGVLLDEGVQIISATEALDTTSLMGRAMVEILQVFASMEAKTIGLRVSASRQHLRKVGRFPGGPVPYGYRTCPHPDGAGRALEIDPTEAAIVRRMADEVLAGKSVYSVAVGLNADGIATRKSSVWSPTVIRRILRSGTVLGRVRTGTLKDDGKTRSFGSVIRDEETGLPVEFWPPILTVEEVERIKALTDWTPSPERGEQTARGHRLRASRLLSGMILCPGCSRPLVVRSHRDAARPAIYACNAGSRGFVCPGGIAIQCDAVENEVARQLLARFGRLPVLETRAVARDVSGLAMVEEAIRETTDGLRDPDADVHALVARLTKLRERRDTLAAVQLAPVVETVDTGMTFRSAWIDAHTDRRRELLIMTGASIAVAPRKVPGRARFDAERVSLELPEDYLAGQDSARAAFGERRESV